MITFVIVAVLLVLGALLFLIPPLLRKPVSSDEGEAALVAAVYRDQQRELDADRNAGTISPSQYEESRRELERRVVEEVPASDRAHTAAGAGRLTPVVLAAAIPLLAAGLYIVLGSPKGIGPLPATQAEGQSPHSLGPQQVAEMVERLAARLKENPNDADGWHMLARSYNAFGRFPEAAEAYSKAAELAPNNAQLLADYADTLAMVNGKNLSGRPMELVEAALKIDPLHQKSLSLAGTAAFNNRDFALAIEYWERLQATLPAGSEGARSVAGSINAARAAAQGTTTVAAAAPPAANPTIKGSLSVSDALAARVSPGDTLFIFARAVNGPRMPLAIVRSTAKDLSAPFTLDDSSAMSPAMKLSNFPEVMLGARISKSGNATPQSGDLMGTFGPVKLGSNEVRITIDTVVP